VHTHAHRTTLHYTTTPPLQDGFDKVIAKVTMNTQTCKDYLDWFQRRAKCEKNYADALTDMCKVHPGGRNPVVDKQEK